MAWISVGNALQKNTIDGKYRISLGALGFLDILPPDQIPSLAPVQSVNGRTGAVVGLAEQSALAAEISRAILQDNIITDNLNSLEESILESAEIGYYDLESDHKTYNNTLLKDREFSLYKDSLGNYLTVGVDYTILSDGGFTLTDSLLDGDVIRIGGSVVLRTIKPITTSLYGGIDGFGQHDSSFSSVETVNRLIANQQFFQNKGTLSQIKIYATKAGLIPFDLWRPNGDGSYTLYWQKQISVVLGENILTAGTDFEIGVDVYEGGLQAFYQNNSTLGNIGWKNMPVASSFILGTSNLLPGSVSTPTTSVRQYAIEVSYEAEPINTRLSELEKPKNINSFLGVVKLVNRLNYADPAIQYGYALNASHVPVVAPDYNISGPIDISDIVDGGDIIVSDGTFPNLAYFYSDSMTYMGRHIVTAGASPYVFQKLGGAKIMLLNINPSHVAMDQYMVLEGNTMPETYIPYEDDPQDPPIIIPKLITNGGGGSAKIPIDAQNVTIGHSMVAQSGTSQAGELIIGFDQLMANVFDFSGGSYKAGFSGHALSAPPSDPSLCIASRLGEIPTNSDRKVYTLLCLTNDFRLSCVIGDYETNFKGNTGVGTVYGAFRVLLDYIYSQDVKSQVIWISDPNRNNSGFASDTLNSLGKNLYNYLDAGYEVMAKNAIPVADINRKSNINPYTLSTFTWDGLHLRNIGYKTAGQELLSVAKAHLF